MHCVFPGFFEVRASCFLLTTELSSDDFPTFDLPTSANSGSPSAGHSSFLVLLFTNSAATTLASLGAYVPRTMLEPLSTLALKAPELVAVAERSMSGGTKSLSRGRWTGRGSSGIGRGRVVRSACGSSEMAYWDLAMVYREYFCGNRRREGQIYGGAETVMAVAARRRGRRQ